MVSGWDEYGDDNDGSEAYADDVKECSECNMEFDGSCPMNSSDCPFAFAGEETSNLFDEEEEDDLNDFEDVEDIDSLLVPDKEAEKAIEEAEKIPEEDLVDDDLAFDEEEEDEDAEELDGEAEELDVDAAADAAIDVEDGKAKGKDLAPDEARQPDEEE